MSASMYSPATCCVDHSPARMDCLANEHLKRRWRVRQFPPSLAKMPVQTCCLSSPAWRSLGTAQQGWQRLTPLLSSLLRFRSARPLLCWVSQILVFQTARKWVWPPTLLSGNLTKLCVFEFYSANVATTWASQTSMFPRDPGQGKPTNVAIILHVNGRKPTNVAIILHHSRFSTLQKQLTWLSFYTIQIFQHGSKPTNVAIILHHSRFST